MPDPRLFPITVVNDYAVQVADVSALIIAANDRRRDLEIVNDLDTVVYISRSNPAAVGDGMKLVPNGSYSMDMQNWFLGAFYAICNPGEDGALTVSEGMVD